MPEGKVALVELELKIQQVTGLQGQRWNGVPTGRHIYFSEIGATVQAQSCGHTGRLTYSHFAH
jgi:hypothetical protein